MPSALFVDGNLSALQEKVSTSKRSLHEGTEQNNREISCFRLLKSLLFQRMYYFIL